MYETSWHSCPRMFFCDVGQTALNVWPVSSGQRQVTLALCGLRDLQLRSYSSPLHYNLPPYLVMLV